MPYRARTKRWHYRQKQGASCARRSFQQLLTRRKEARLTTRAPICRYFATYSGVKLPIKLSQELDAAAIENRNTFFRGYFDESGRMTGFQKMVYGEVEMQHSYAFDESGQLKQAEITDVEGETTVMHFE